MGKGNRPKGINMVPQSTILDSYSLPPVTEGIIRAIISTYKVRNSGVHDKLGSISLDINFKKYRNIYISSKKDSEVNFIIDQVKNEVLASYPEYNPKKIEIFVEKYTVKLESGILNKTLSQKTSLGNFIEMIYVNYEIKNTCKKIKVIADELAELTKEKKGIQCITSSTTSTTSNANTTIVTNITDTINTVDMVDTTSVTAITDTVNTVNTVDMVDTTIVTAITDTLNTVDMVDTTIVTDILPVDASKEKPTNVSTELIITPLVVSIESDDTKSFNEMLKKLNPKTKTAILKHHITNPIKIVDCELPIIYNYIEKVQKQNLSEEVLSKNIIDYITSYSKGKLSGCVIRQKLDLPLPNSLIIHGKNNPKTASTSSTSSTSSTPITPITTDATPSTSSTPSTTHATPSTSSTSSTPDTDKVVDTDKVIDIDVELSEIKNILKPLETKAKPSDEDIKSILMSSGKSINQIINKMYDRISNVSNVSNVLSNKIPIAEDKLDVKMDNPEISNLEKTNVAKTNVAKTNVAKTNVAKTGIVKTDIEKFISLNLDCGTNDVHMDLFHTIKSDSLSDKSNKSNNLLDQMESAVKNYNPKEDSEHQESEIDYSEGILYIAKLLSAYASETKNEKADFSKLRNYKDFMYFCYDNNYKRHPKDLCLDEHRLKTISFKKHMNVICDMVREHCIEENLDQTVISHLTNIIYSRVPLSRMSGLELAKNIITNIVELNLNFQTLINFANITEVTREAYRKYDFSNKVKTIQIKYEEYVSEIIKQNIINTTYNIFTTKDDNLYVKPIDTAPWFREIVFGDKVTKLQTIDVKAARNMEIVVVLNAKKITNPEALRYSKTVCFIGCEIEELDIFPYLDNCVRLYLQNCPGIKSLEYLHKLNNLNVLLINFCWNIKKIPDFKNITHIYVVSANPKTKNNLLQENNTYESYGGCKGGGGGDVLKSLINNSKNKLFSPINDPLIVKFLNDYYYSGKISFDVNFIHNILTKYDIIKSLDDTKKFIDSKIGLHQYNRSCFKFIDYISKK